MLQTTKPTELAHAFWQVDGLPIEAPQGGEILPPGAPSFFALAILANLSISVREAWLLFGLFWAQFIIGGVVPESVHGVERIAVSVIYLTLGAGILLRDRRRLPRVLRAGLPRPPPA